MFEVKENLKRQTYDFPKIETSDIESILDWDYTKTKLFNYNSGEKIPWRISTDDNLLFVFEKGIWRFFGVRGNE